MGNEALKIYGSLKRPVSFFILLAKNKKKLKETIMLPVITARYVFSCFAAIKIVVFVEIFCRKINV